MDCSITGLYDKDGNPSKEYQKFLDTMSSQEDALRAYLESQFTPPEESQGDVQHEGFSTNYGHLFNPKKGTTDNIQAVLRRIANGNSNMSKIAKAILPYVPNMPIHIETSLNTVNILTTDGPWAGKYLPSQSPQIILNPYANIGQSIPETVVVHEAIHAATYIKIRDPKYQVLKAELERLFEQVKKYESKLSDTYPLINLDEFMTGLFTRPTFIRDLKKIKTDRPTEFKNLFEELFHYILSLFKIKKGNNLYESSFAVTSQIIAATNPSNPTLRQEQAVISLELNHGFREKKGNKYEYKTHSPGKYLRLLDRVMAVNKKLPDGYKAVIREASPKTSEKKHTKHIVKILKQTYSAENSDNVEVSGLKQKNITYLKGPIEIQINALKKEMNSLIEEEVNEGVINNIKLAEIAEKIAELKKESNKIEKSETAQDILNQWPSQQERLLELINKQNPNAQEIREANKIYEIWQSITQFEKVDHPIWDGEDVTYNLDENGVPDNPLISELLDIENALKLIGNSLNNKKLEIIRNFASDELGRKLTLEDVTKAISDISNINANVLNLSQVDHPLIQAVWKAMNTVKNRAVVKIQDKFEELDTLLKTVVDETGMSNKEIFEMMFEEWADGRKTTDLIDKYTPEYIYELRKNKGILRESWNSLLKKDLELAEKQQAEDNWRKAFNWISENNYFVNMEAFVPDAQINEEESIPNEFLNPHSGITAEDEKARIIALVGTEKAEEIIQLAIQKAEKYKRKRYIEWQKLSNNPDIKNPKEAMKTWILQHDPYSSLQNIGGNSQKPSLYNNVYFSNKSEHLNEKFKQIEDSPALLKLHKAYKEIINQVANITGQSKYRGGWMSVNSLPFFKAAIIDKAFEGGNNIAGDLMNFIKGVIAEDVNEDANDKYIDPITGKEVSNFKNKSVRNKNNTISKKYNIKLAEFVKENNYREPTEEEKFELKKQVMDELATDQSIDVHRLMKLMVADGELTKQNQTIEDQFRLVSEYFNNEYTGISRNKAGVDTNREADVRHIKDLLNFTLDDKFWGYTTRKTEGNLGKLRTKDEKAYVAEIQKKIEKLRAKTPKDEEDAIMIEETIKQLENDIKNTGKTVTWSRIIDSLIKYVQLKGMGWNFFSATANLLFGITANLTESADGRQYTIKELWQGYLESFNFKNSKARAVMSRFDMLNNQVNETFERNQDSTLYRNLRKAFPYKMIEWTEWLNQAPQLIAMMKATKATGPNGEETNMWEAYDESGRLREGYSLGQKGDDQATREAEFITRVKQQIARTHGDYYNKQMLKTNSIGRAATQFRTWMFEGYANRLIGETADEVFGYRRKGRYLSYKKSHLVPILGQIKLIQDGIKAFRNQYVAGTNPADMEMDSANMRKNILELAFLLSSFTIGMIMKHATADGEDDDDMLGFLWNFTINQSTRLQTELAFYLNPNEFERLNKNILPIMKLLEDSRDFVDAHYRMFDDRDVIIQSGPFEGMNWMLREWMEAVPPFTAGMSLYRRSYDILE